jgi:N utilization substance protein A
VCNALAPAEISRVIIDEANRSMEVVVPDEFLSIAIGKKGQNVRLASKLTGWHLDVKSESKYSQAMQTGYDSLVALPGVGISLADALYEKGFYSAEEIGNASIEDLIQIRGIGEDKAHKLIEAAKMAIAAGEASNESGQTAAAPENTEDETGERAVGEESTDIELGETAAAADSVDDEAGENSTVETNSAVEPVEEQQKPQLAEESEDIKTDEV